MIDMNINSQNAKKIDSYINDYKSIADLNDHEKVRIQGKKVKRPVYRLPLNYLLYNAGNGRFAKEYLKLQKEMKHELDPLIPEHADRIEKMLLEQNPGKTDWLENNLRDEGQQEYGIITHDGYVINGNRRLSVLKSRLSGKGNDEHEYMKVARLPKNIDEIDVIKIELEKQMAREQKLDYGPINNLLKIKNCRTKGMTVQQIASTIGFTIVEIENDLEKLELIQKYLKFICQPDNFEAVDELSDHFGDSLKYTFSKKQLKKKRFTPRQLMDARDITFALMQAKVPTKALRALPDMMDHKDIGPVFFSATSHTKSNPEKVLEIFETCQIRKKAIIDSKKPIKQLNNILGIAVSVDLTHPELKKQENKVLINNVLKFAKKLEKFS
jgi:hypothetical protein